MRDHETMLEDLEAPHFNCRIEGKFFGEDVDDDDNEDMDVDKDGSAADEASEHDDQEQAVKMAGYGSDGLVCSLRSQRRNLDRLDHQKLGLHVGRCEAVERPRRQQGHNLSLFRMAVATLSVIAGILPRRGLPCQNQAQNTLHVQQLLQRCYLGR